MLKIQNMRSGEKVLKVIRRHWIIFALLGLYLVGAFILTLVIFATFGLRPVVMLGMILFWMIYSLFLYIKWLNHELDLFVVTNNRIIGVEQISFLNRTVSECNLGQVQEVNSQTNGLFANLLNYGTVSIQTAGTERTLEMGFAPNAMQEARKVLNIVDDYRDVHQSVAKFKGNLKEDRVVDGK